MSASSYTAPRAAYFAGSAGPLFGSYHRPLLPLQHSCGLVLCAPLFYEQTYSYRTLRHLAERLATAGFATLRFDYHGTGNSDGDELARDRLATWQRDLFAAAAELKRQSGVCDVGFIGLHIGCLLALSAAAEHGEVASMILWDPCRSGSSYVKELSYLDYFIGRGFQADCQAPASAEREIRGFKLTAETLAKLTILDPKRLQRRPAPKMLWVRTKTMDTELAAHLRGCGVDLECQYHPGRWRLLEEPHKALIPEVIFRAMIAWLKRQHPRQLPRVDEDAQARTAVGRIASKHSAEALCETPIRFGEANPLFGIVTEPPAQQRKPSRPAILLLNSGCISHVGPHRLYVTMARTWAELGYCVLRFDLSGLGDSRAAAFQRENQIYPADAVRDVQQAMTALAARQAAESFVLVGNCSGAAVAFQTAIADARVAGLAMLNPAELYFGDRGSDAYDVEDFELHRYLCKCQNLHELPPLWQGSERYHARMLLRRKLRRVALRLVRRIAYRAAPPDAAADFRALLHRQVKLLLVYSEDDIGLSALEMHLGRNLQKLGSASGIRVETTKGGDHIFGSLAAKAELITRVTDYLTEQHP